VYKRQGEGEGVSVGFGGEEAEGCLGWSFGHG